MFSILVCIVTFLLVDGLLSATTFGRNLRKIGRKDTVFFINLQIFQQLFFEPKWFIYRYIRFFEAMHVHAGFGENLHIYGHLSASPNRDSSSRSKSEGLQIIGCNQSRSATLTTVIVLQLTRKSTLFSRNSMQPPHCSR